MSFWNLAFIITGRRAYQSENNNKKKNGQGRRPRWSKWDYMPCLVVIISPNVPRASARRSWPLTVAHLWGIDPTFHFRAENRWLADFWYYHMTQSMRISTEAYACGVAEVLACSCFVNATIEIRNSKYYTSILLRRYLSYPGGCCSKTGCAPDYPTSGGHEQCILPSARRQGYLSSGKGYLTGRRSQGNPGKGGKWRMRMHVGVTQNLCPIRILCHREF